MSIDSSELVLYSSASHPSDDTSLTGGTINLNIRPEFTQFTATAIPVFKSDGADTRSVDVIYRTATGAYTTATIILDGTNEVPCPSAAERLLSAIAQTTSGSRTISILQGSGGTVRATIPVSEKGITANFINSASEAGAVNRYEKYHWKNTHLTQTLNSAIVTLTADPVARITIGLSLAKNDTGTVANRKTAPAGVSFVDDNVDITVPTGLLAAGEFISQWTREGLLASDAPFKSNYVSRLLGTST